MTIHVFAADNNSNLKKLTACNGARGTTGRCGKHAGALAKTSFLMCFARAVARVNLLAISIKLAISIYFDCTPAISIAILIISPPNCELSEKRVRELVDQYDWSVQTLQRMPRM
jgi:hypothetical protein